MAHKLLRLTESLYKDPLLITPQLEETIYSYLSERNNGEILQELSVAQQLEKASGSLGATSEGGVGVLSVDGPLTYQTTGFEPLCGGTSYQSLLEQAKQLGADPSVSSVVMDVDSGGGQAYSVFESANDIKAALNGKPLIAYVDGTSASAAYALSSVADEIIVNPMAEVGSIGVVVRMQNDSEKKKMEGVKDVYVYAGDSKIPYAEDGEFREDFISDIQSKVDVLYEEFVSHVAEARNISAEVVRGTQAKTFEANKAIELGLADKIMTREEFANYLADISSTNEGGSMPLFNKSDKAKEHLETMSTETEMSAQLDAMQAQMAEMAEALEASKAQATEYKQTIEAKEKEAKQAELSSKVQGYTFLQDTEAVVAMAEGMEDSTVLFSAFDAAQEAINSAEAKAEEAESIEASKEEAEEKLNASVEANSEMFQEVAAKADEEALADSIDARKDAIAAKMIAFGNKKSK